MSGLEWVLYILVILCGGAGLAYGVFTRQAVLAMPSGNDRMREIAAAIQEGASAYLNRQYMTIGIVGVVISHPDHLPGLSGRHRLPDRRRAVGLHRLHRHERLGAGQRAHGPGRGQRGLAAGLDVAFKAGAVTGMLVVALGLLGVAVYYCILLVSRASPQPRPCCRRWSAWPSAPR